ncbi:hypothetical protein F5878DRAFT_668134 [Lentinula raphanica]|uniref:Uncharacterized protein n=1 Tax=Lentinula raphanica TaxID=153919 RepID=A0AA38NUM9_9AGAR|nr:hypothetical protein F5878DRAFT_668134 [Lentinula raphanica]
MSFHHPSPRLSSRLVLGSLLQVFDGCSPRSLHHTTLEICRISESSPTHWKSVRYRNRRQHTGNLSDSGIVANEQYVPLYVIWIVLHQNQSLVDEAACSSFSAPVPPITVVDKAASSSSYFPIEPISQGLVA